MKKTVFLILLITIISLFSSIAFAATETCDKSYDAVAYFPFDADASDASGNGNDGTVSGATWSATAGYGGSGAYSFDGTNEDYISVSSISGKDTGSSGATFMGWVYSTTSGTNRHVLDSEGGGFFIDSFSIGRWVAQAEDAGAMNYYTPGVLGVGVQATLNTWEHMAAVLDPATSEIRAYINGVEYISSGKTNLDEDIISLFIGRNGVYSGANANYFTGVIDEVRVFDSVLSADDIEHIYTGQYQCDDGYLCTEDETCEATDTDEDGISDIDEATYGTDPEDSDSDDDGLDDYEEIITYGTDPNESDSDDDGIDDEDEIAAGSDPNDTDSDDDGYTDGEEGDAGTDPNDATAYPTTPRCNDKIDNDGDGRIDYLGGCDCDKDGDLDVTPADFWPLKGTKPTSYLQLLCANAGLKGYGTCATSTKGTWIYLDKDCTGATDNIEATLTIIKKPSIIGKAIAASETGGDLSWMMVIVGILGIIGVTAVIIKKEK